MADIQLGTERVGWGWGHRVRGVKGEAKKKEEVANCHLAPPASGASQRDGHFVPLCRL